MVNLNEQFLFVQGSYPPADNLKKVLEALYIIGNFNAPIKLIKLSKKDIKKFPRLMDFNKEHNLIWDNCLLMERCNLVKRIKIPGTEIFESFQEFCVNEKITNQDIKDEFFRLLAGENSDVLILTKEGENIIKTIDDENRLIKFFLAMFKTLEPAYFQLTLMEPELISFSFNKKSQWVNAIQQILASGMDSISKKTEANNITNWFCFFNIITAGEDELNNKILRVNHRILGNYLYLIGINCLNEKIGLMETWEDIEKRLKESFWNSNRIYETFLLENLVEIILRKNESKYEWYKSERRRNLYRNDPRKGILKINNELSFIILSDEEIDYFMVRI